MSKKILIVEDNMQDQKVMRIALSREGFDDIDFVATGEEAIERCRDAKADVVICDTILPGIDGVEVCRQIKSFDLKSTPKIIVQTGVVDAVDAGKARRAGADDYVVKASDCGPLLEALRQI